MKEENRKIERRKPEKFCLHGKWHLRKLESRLKGNYGCCIFLLFLHYFYEMREEKSEGGKKRWKGGKKMTWKDRGKERIRRRRRWRKKSQSRRNKEKEERERRED